MERLRELLDKIPMSLIVMAFVAYLGWDAYDFSNGESSELVQARSQLDTTRKDNEAKKKEIASAKEFYEKLELKRLELRALAQQLDQLKATLSERLDIPAFMRTVDLEASRVGLRILSFKPTSAKAEEYYLEQSF